MKRRETIKLTVQWNPEKRNPKKRNPQKDYSDEGNWGTQKTRIPKKGNPESRKGFPRKDITWQRELGEKKSCEKGYRKVENSGKGNPKTGNHARKIITT